MVPKIRAPRPADAQNWCSVAIRWYGAPITGAVRERQQYSVYRANTSTAMQSTVPFQKGCR
jgi:hypothetical protein